MDTNIGQDNFDLNDVRCRDRILSDDYADYVISYNGDTEFLEEYFQGDCLKILDNYLAIVNLPRQNVDLMSVIIQSYYLIPKCYGLMDTTSLEESGIIKTQNQPVLNLRGRDTLIGVIDTGVDYQNPLFRKEDGSTRILRIWDQTVQSGTSPDELKFGSEYTEEDINAALQSEEPLNIVPSVDEQGHGTFVTGIMAGGRDDAGDFTGIAPQAGILVVKLKKAKQYLKDFYFIDVEDVYQETDIMLAVYYLYEQARKLGFPISIYLGVGTNSGDHSGRGPLNEYLNRLNVSPGTVISLPAGNEGNARHHTSGFVLGNEPYKTIEINVGEAEAGFVLEIWGDAPNTYAVGFESPYGEVVDRIPPRFMTGQRIPFFLERTVLEVSYVLVEEFTGRQLIFIRFSEPTEGIWRIRLYAAGNIRNAYHLWLPIRNFITDNTYFLQPVPEVTITEPSTSDGPICTTAYNHMTNALYIEAGRGFTSTGNVKPDLAAPGVNIYGPDLIRGSYTRKTGTSIAAAHTAGAAALILEWANSRGNAPSLNGNQIRRYLIRGARRTAGTEYPSDLWGYGTLDLYGTFETLQQREG